MSDFAGLFSGLMRWSKVTIAWTIFVDFVAIQKPPRISYAKCVQLYKKVKHISSKHWSIVRLQTTPVKCQNRANYPSEKQPNANVLRPILFGLFMPARVFRNVCKTYQLKRAFNSSPCPHGGFWRWPFIRGSAIHNSWQITPLPQSFQLKCLEPARFADLNHN